MIEGRELHAPLERVEDPGVVAHQHERSTLIRAELPDKTKSLHRVAGIEVTRGFVREDELGAIGKRTSQRDPLLLAYG